MKEDLQAEKRRWMLFQLIAVIVLSAMVLLSLDLGLRTSYKFFVIIALSMGVAAIAAAALANLYIHQIGGYEALPAKDRVEWETYRKKQPWVGWLSVVFNIFIFLPLGMLLGYGVKLAGDIFHFGFWYYVSVTAVIVVLGVLFALTQPLALRTRR